MATATSDFATALNVIRDQYDDGYGGRSKLLGDLRDFAQDRDINLPDKISHPDAMFPVARYQNHDPETVVSEIRRKIDQPEADEIIEILTTFGNEGL